MCRTAEEVDFIWNDNTREITNELFLPEYDIFLATYRTRTDLLKPVETGSLPIAIVTTAMARLHLLDLLMQIGEDRLLYCDTGFSVFYTRKTENISDSVMFEGHPDEADVKNFISNNVGTKLGDLTSEIAPDFYGAELVCPGAF